MLCGVQTLTRLIESTSSVHLDAALAIADHWNIASWDVRMRHVAWALTRLEDFGAVKVSPSHISCLCTCTRIMRKV